MKRFFYILFFMLILPKPVYAVDISAKCCCLMIKDTNEVIFEKDMNVKHSIASTTKIMTALVALENSDFNETVVVSSFAASQEGSSIYVEKDDKVKMKDLVYGLMLNSGNDASVAIAEHISGNIDDFSKLMNKKAKEIGAINTNFKNPSGLDNDMHYSTAYDMALITGVALNNEVFTDIVSTTNYSFNINDTTHYLKNHNKLLWNYEDCIGVKTGYTKKTGRCLVSAASRNGITLICVTLDDSDDWKDHKELLDYGFDVCKTKTVLKKNSVVDEYKNRNNTIHAICSKDVIIPYVNDNKIEVCFHTVDKIKNSIDKNEKIGSGVCKFGNNATYTFDIISDNKIVFENKSFFEIIKFLFSIMT